MTQSKSFNVWLILPSLLFINFTYNIWLWCSIQGDDTEWGVWSRSVGAIATFALLPFSRLIEKLSYKKIVLGSTTFFVLAIFIGLLGVQPTYMSLSILLLSISSYLLIFRTQLLLTYSESGATELRRFTTWYGMLCMVSPLLASYFSEYFIISNYWWLVSLIMVPFVIHVIYESNKTIVEDIKVNQHLESETHSSISLYKMAFKDKDVWSLIRQSIIFSGTMNMLNIIIPIWVNEQGWLPSKAGELIFMSGIASLAIRLIIHKKHFNENETYEIVKLTSWFCVIFFMTIPFCGDFLVACIISILYGIFYGIGAPLSLSYYALIARKKAYSNAIWSIRSAIGGILAISTPFALGWAVKFSILNSVWFCSSLLAILPEAKTIKKQIVFYSKTKLRNK